MNAMRKTADSYYALQITFRLGPVEIVNFFVNIRSHGWDFQPKHQKSWQFQPDRVG
jgi:hypothetical protein